jgi:hypothetical protein
MIALWNRGRATAMSRSLIGKPARGGPRQRVTGKPGAPTPYRRDEPGGAASGAPTKHRCRPRQPAPIRGHPT